MWIEHRKPMHHAAQSVFDSKQSGQLLLQFQWCSCCHFLFTTAQIDGGTCHGPHLCLTLDVGFVSYHLKIMLWATGTGGLPCETQTCIWGSLTPD